MNTSPLRLLALLAASLLFVSFARADETSYANVLKERDAVLSNILTMREAHFAVGGYDEEAVSSARLALWYFRRDTASTKAEKLKQQELIVAFYEKKLVALQSRVASGLVGSEEVLLATDAHLQAQQLHEEFRLDGRKS
ncbi:MAG: hypothetical protein ABIZ04_09950 [Opitutus sp.]